MSERFYTVVGEGGVLVVRVREQRDQNNYADGHVIAKCDQSDAAYVIAEALQKWTDSE